MCLVSGSDTKPGLGFRYKYSKNSICSLKGLGFGGLAYRASRSNSIWSERHSNSVLPSPRPDSVLRQFRMKTEHFSSLWPESGLEFRYIY